MTNIFLFWEKVFLCYFKFFAIDWALCSLLDLFVSGIANEVIVILASVLEDVLSSLFLLLKSILFSSTDLFHAIVKAINSFLVLLLHLIYRLSCFLRLLSLVTCPPRRLSWSLRSSLVVLKDLDCKYFSTPLLCFPISSHIPCKDRLVWLFPNPCVCAAWTSSVFLHFVFGV